MPEKSLFSKPTLSCSLTEDGQYNRVIEINIRTGELQGIECFIEAIKTFGALLTHVHHGIMVEPVPVAVAASATAA